MAAKLDRKIVKEFEMNCTDEKRTNCSKIREKNGERILNELHKRTTWNEIKGIKSRGMQGYEEVMGKGLKTNCNANRLQKTKKNADRL